MKWWPGEAKSGDMIRVRLGSIYHFGVYVSDDEVIQFGPPPVDLNRKNEDICVIATDIDAFSVGSIVEVAQFDKKELKMRVPPKKAVEVARSRIGEKGYNLIHNNCEHFANECVLGIKQSAQENEARERWLKRPILDLYICHIPDECEIGEVSDKKRAKEIASVKNEKVKKEKYLAWHLLEIAFKNSAKTDISNVKFAKSINGKWTADGHFFSITHTDGVVAVVYSNSPCGIDIETLDTYNSRHEKRTEKLVNYVIAKGEEIDCDAESFLKLWTKKESIFKYSTFPRFVPRNINTKDYPVETYVTDNGTYISIASEKLKYLKFFDCDAGVKTIEKSEFLKTY